MAKRRKRTRRDRATRPRPAPRPVAADVPEVDLGEFLELPLRDRAALAPNWRTPLRVDTCIGLALLLLGVSMLAGDQRVLGALLVAGGAAYTGLVARRWRRWGDIRRRAGLDRRRPS